MLRVLSTMPFAATRRLSAPTGIILAIVGALLLLAGILSFAVHQTQSALAQLAAQNLEAATVHAGRARQITAPLRAITFNASDSTAWDAGLSSITALAAAQTEAGVFTQALAHASDAPPDLVPLASALEQLATATETTTVSLDQSLVAKRFIPNDQISKLKQISSALHRVTTIAHPLTQGDQTWVVMLQNSAELRATGGFTGSYALIHLREGKIAEIVIEDIYDADGQFLGYVSPPAGIREYTSSGKGLRLPDANWWPDFPKSAQTQLQFFSLADREPLSGLVAVNVDAVAQLLEITGPIWLPDYELELTAPTLASALRTDRDDFFPGSIQKKQLIAHALTMIRQQLTQLDGPAQQRLATLLPELLKEKQLQAYAVDPALQQQFREAAISGEIGRASPQSKALIDDCRCSPAVLALVESNVGINKSNPAVTRTVALDWQPEPRRLTVTIAFTHDGSYQPTSSRETSGYVNYQRILTSPNLTVQAVQIDGQALSNWDVDSITTTAGEVLTQTGFLVPLPSGQEKTATIELETSQDATVMDAILLHSQSGLTPPEYWLQTAESSNRFTLNHDMLISLK